MISTKISMVVLIQTTLFERLDIFVFFAQKIFPIFSARRKEISTIFFGWFSILLRFGAQNKD